MNIEQASTNVRTTTPTRPLKKLAPLAPCNDLSNIDISRLQAEYDKMYRLGFKHDRIMETLKKKWGCSEIKYRRATGLIPVRITAIS